MGFGFLWVLFVFVVFGRRERKRLGVINIKYFVNEMVYVDELEGIV